jgi:hypothetical protein
VRDVASAVVDPALGRLDRGDRVQELEVRPVRASPDARTNSAGSTSNIRRPYNEPLTPNALRRKAGKRHGMSPTALV